MRRIGLAMSLVLLLAGCKKSFDERYADAEKKIREEAGSIDQELAKREKERREAEALVAASPGQADEQASESSPRPSARNSPGK